MPPDLRQTPCNDVIARVAPTFDVQFDSSPVVRKRRSLGLRTTRNTWVRIEVKDLSRLDGQSWGIEAAATFHGVSMPAWHQGTSWLDSDQVVIWRADETDYVTDLAIKPGGVLVDEPALSNAWWQTFNASLDALATHPTTRVATPNLERITQDRVAKTIRASFPDVDTTCTEWIAAHGDLAWSNLTAPTCVLLDWEDSGIAPRGWDAATLWSQSLAVPALAKRIVKDRHADLGTRAGKLAQLYHCAELIADGEDYAGPLYAPAQAAAGRLVSELGM